MAKVVKFDDVTKNLPKLTEPQRKAGIRQIICRNPNGSFHCLVDLTKVDKWSKTNYRMFDPAHAKKIDRTFDIVCVRTPILRFYNSKLDSVDGRHTTDLLLAHGIEVYTATVYFGCSDALAAKIFYEVAMNTKRMDPWSSYNAALVAKYQHTLDIEELMKEFNFSCPAHDGFGMRNADIRSASPLYEAYAANGKEFVRKMFQVIHMWRERSFAKEVPYVCGKSEFLRGLLDVLASTDTNKDFDSLVWRLTNYNPQTIEDHASGNDQIQRSRITRSHYMCAMRRLSGLKMYG